MASFTVPIVTPIRHLPMRMRLVEPLSDDALFDFAA